MASRRSGYGRQAAAARAWESAAAGRAAQIRSNFVQQSQPRTTRPSGSGSWRRHQETHKFHSEW